MSKIMWGKIMKAKITKAGDDEAAEIRGAIASRKRQ